MKLMWQSISKSMGAQIDHAHMRIKTCTENDQNGNGCVPEPWNTMRCQGKGLMHN